MSSSFSAAVYLNGLETTVNNSNFTNNNYGKSIQKFQGGFLDIQSNNFAATNTIFKNSLASKGSAVSITSSSSGANYSFNSCIFSSLIASTSGAVVFMAEVSNSTVLSFDSCLFTEIASKQGGVVYLSFIVYSNLPSDYSVFPTISLTSCNSTHVYAS